jgi:hypothetical protein
MRSHRAMHGRLTIFGGIAASVVLALLPPVAAASSKDRDGDGLSNRFEKTRSHTNPGRADTDRDRLGDRFELRTSQTNPRRPDTDGDGLRDGFEVHRSKTSPRREDTDADGSHDGVEVLLGTDPRRKPHANPSLLLPGWLVPAAPQTPVAAQAGPAPQPAPAPQPDPPLGDPPAPPQDPPPAPPAPDVTPPDTTITSGPSGVVASSSATFAFTSSEPGSTFECRLDSGAWTACASPRNYAVLSNGVHTFEVRAEDTARNVDPSAASQTWTVAVPAADPGAPDPPTADFTWSPEQPKGPPPTRVDFTATGSCPASPCTYSWSHSDAGEFGTGPTATFYYQSLGDKGATLTVTDSLGRSDAIEKPFTVVAGDPPPPPPPPPPPSGDAVWFVAPGGSGTACTEAEPCGTFNAAYHRASLGDVVNVAPGTYGNQAITPRSLPGTNSQIPSGDEITFRAQGEVRVNGRLELGSLRSSPVEHIAFEDMELLGWTVIRAGEDVHFTRMVARGQVHANWVHYLSYRHMEVGPVTDDTGDGLQFNKLDNRAGDHILIDGLYLHDVHPTNTAAHPDAIQVFGPFHDMTLRNSVLVRNEHINLRADGEQHRLLVENNVFGRRTGNMVPSWFAADIPGRDAVIRNNTFHGAIQVPSGGQDISNQVWANNLAETYGYGSCGLFDPSHTVVGNVWYGDQGAGCGKVISSPGWVNAGADDYHLAAGSGAIDSASPAHAPAADRDGNPRDAAPDAGAYEFQP